MNIGTLIVLNVALYGHEYSIIIDKLDPYLKCITAKPYDEGYYCKITNSMISLVTDIFI